MYEDEFIEFGLVWDYFKSDNGLEAEIKIKSVKVSQGSSNSVKNLEINFYLPQTIG